MDRWTEAEAMAWWNARAWLCGFNFLPSTAVNFLEMWHRDTFDAATIERELGWASDLGFNAFRINLHYLVWKHDRDGLLDRLDRVMGMGEAVGINAIPVLFDDCGFGGFEPEYGPQPDPVPGVHNSRAVASPGRAMLYHGTERDGFQRYVADIVGRFRTDQRIAFWDLYNEPGNRMIFGQSGADLYLPDFSEQSLELMRTSFDVARGQTPYQPVTVGAWSTPVAGVLDTAYETEIDRTALELSDILTFHAYLSSAKVADIIAALELRGRPMICTEWMARPVGSRISDQLEMFRQHDVGCVQWGLVQGRTQTWLPWPEELVAAHGGDADRSVWFHDILYPSGAPYDASEAETLRGLNLG